MADEVGSVTFKVNVESGEAQENLKEASNSVAELADTAETTEKRIEKSTSGISTKTKVMAAAIGVALVAIGKQALDAFNTFDAGKTIIANATGASGKQLQDFVEITKAVYTDTEASFDSLASTLGEINTRFGYTGEQLQRMTKTFADFADATGMDATQAVKNLSQTINQWGLDAEAIPGIMDKLVTAGQLTGASVEGITTALTENAGTLQGFGYSMDDAISMMMSFEKSGVNASEVLMGMKQSFAESAKAGTDARADWDKLIDSITNCTDETEANNLAINTFGSRIAGSLVQNLRKGTIQFGEFSDAIANSQGALERTDEAGETFQDRITHLKRVGETLLADFLEKLIPYIDEMLPDLVVVIKGLGEAIGWLGAKLVPVFATITNGVIYIKELISSFNELEDEESALAAASERTAKIMEETARQTEAVDKKFNQIVKDNPALIDAIKSYCRTLNDLNEQYAETGTQSGQLTEDLESLEAVLAEYGITAEEAAIFNEKLANAESKVSQNAEKETKAINSATKAVDGNAGSSEELKKRKEELRQKVLQINKALQDESSEYDNLRMQYEADASALQEANDLKVISQEEYNSTMLALDEAYAKKKDELQKQSASNTISSIQNALGIAQQAFSSLFDTMNNYYDLELAKVEDTYEKELAELNYKLNTGQISQEEYNNALTELERETAKEKDRIAREQFESQKASKIAEALINAAQAIIMCWAQLGPIGGIAGTIAVGIATGIEIAKIKQQQYVSGSYATGAYNITQDQQAMVHKGETILRPADAERFRSLGGLYGIETALSQPLQTSGLLNTFNLNNQMNAVIEIDGTQLGIAVLKNIDNAKQFIY